MSLPRHICKGVLIRPNNAPDLCTAVGCQQFRKESEKCQRRIMFERNYQRWGRKHKARSQGQRHEKSDAKAKDTKKSDAKAKDLIFEAKVKDIKMCPRGQGRP